MFRHYDISDDDETVALASLFENREELIAAPRRTKKRQAAVAGGSDKVQVVSAVDAMQAAGHNKPMVQAASYPPLQRTQGRGTQSSGTGNARQKGGPPAPGGCNLGSGGVCYDLDNSGQCAPGGLGLASVQSTIGGIFAIQLCGGGCGVHYHWQWQVPTYKTDCYGSLGSISCGLPYLIMSGGWQQSLVDSGDGNAANNDSWGWTFTKSFFTGFSLKTVYRSFVDPDGCDNLMATTIGSDISPFPTDDDSDSGIGPGDVAEIAPKAAGALGVINGLQVPALELSAGLETAGAWAAPVYVGGHALYTSGAAAYREECH